MINIMGYRGSYVSDTAHNEIVVVLLKAVLSMGSTDRVLFNFVNLISCPEGILFGYIFTHKRGSIIDVYLLLETVAAKDLVPMVSVFGKGG
ncbi:hypothetical protein WISP_62489 [Willisornis vidua]|uniref:Uncharacterized protein n=1 Tax=Willisornis vidua TaxID=1566151 RepID=A0ABQ9DCY1_9PASS|nr:hypothetical protein WISP_62489 [Willisornis vidua]